jgi:hypothetical protein
MAPRTRSQQSPARLPRARSILSDTSDDEAVPVSAQNLAQNPAQEARVEFPSKHEFNTIIDQQIKRAESMIQRTITRDMNSGSYYGFCHYTAVFDDPAWTYGNEIVREAFVRVRAGMAAKNLIYSFKFTESGFYWKVNFDTEERRFRMWMTLLQVVVLFLALGGAGYFALAAK